MSSPSAAFAAGPRTGWALEAAGRACYRQKVVGAVEAEDAGRDRSLVEGLARGDASALAELYDRHAPVLGALARRILGSAVEAEDLVHDVFLEAWRHATDYDAERGSVRAWLVLRCRSRALDRRKSAPVSRTVSPADDTWLERVPDDQAPSGLGPDEQVLRRLLLELPEEQRTVLWLGYFEGLSSSEIAERIAVPVGTVKSRVAAALGRLRNALKVTRS